MKSLRIIDQNFQQLGEITQYNSLLMTHRFHTIGEIELNINRYSPNAELLTKGRMLRFDGRNDKVYVIKHREIKLDQGGKGSENWSIRALPLKAFLMQRITYPPSHTAYDNKSGPAETVMKHYVERNFINPDNPDRIFTNLVIAPNQGRGANLSWQSRFKNVAEELSEMSLLSGIGWEIRIDIQNQQFIFDIVEGDDRTAGQILLPPVKFAPQFNTIKEMNYSETDMNYRNVAIVAGPGEGIDRIVAEAGESSGRDRHEIFIDARDVPDETESEVEGEDPTPRPVAEIEADLLDRGERELEKAIQEEYLEAQILTSMKEVKKFQTQDIPDAGTSENLIETAGSISLATEEAVYEEITGENLLRDSDNIPVNSTDRPAVVAITFSGGVTRIEVIGNGSNWNAYTFIQSYLTDSGFFSDVGEKYTISAEVRMTAVNGATITFDTRTPAESIYSPLVEFGDTNGTWQQVSSTMTMPERAPQTRSLLAFNSLGTPVIGDVLEIRNIKLEKSDAATPWSPAIEDVGLEEYRNTWMQKVLKSKEGIKQLKAIALSGQYSNSLVHFDTSQPAVTSAVVECSRDKVQWLSVKDGESFPLFEKDEWLTGKTLYIRQRLTTQDAEFTPTLSSFTAEFQSYQVNRVLSTGPFEYEQDFFLGDIVTVRNKSWGVSLDARITEIVEAYEQGGYSIEATFGNNRPTLIDKIKQQFQQLNGEIRK